MWRVGTLSMGGIVKSGCCLDGSPMGTWRSEGDGFCGGGYAFERLVWVWGAVGGCRVMSFPSFVKIKSLFGFVKFVMMKKFR